MRTKAMIGLSLGSILIVWRGISATIDLVRWWQHDVLTLTQAHLLGAFVVLGTGALAGAGFRLFFRMRREFRREAPR